MDLRRRKLIGGGFFIDLIHTNLIEKQKEEKSTTN